jgi:hypothetical protein
MVTAGSDLNFRIIFAALGRLGGVAVLRNGGEGSVAAKLWMVAIVPCSAAIYRKFLSKIDFARPVERLFPAPDFSLAVVACGLGTAGAMACRLGTLLRSGIIAFIASQGNS